MNNLSEQVSLKESAKALGVELAYELSPILVAKNGEIIDGVHRKGEDRKWKKRVIKEADTAVKIAASRLCVNHNRRISEEEDFEQLARALQKEEPGDKPYTVKSGKTIVARINEITGIPTPTVYENLINPDFKDPVKAKAGATDTVTLGKGEQIRVPKSLVPEVTEFIKQTKKTIEAASSTEKETEIQEVKNKLQATNDALKHEILKKKALSKIKVESPNPPERIPTDAENKDRAEVPSYFTAKMMRLRITAHCKSLE